MRSRTVGLALLVLSLLVGLVQSAQAQSAPLRKGFWFNIGFGYGSLGCEDCSDRTGGFSGGLSLGGTISQHVLLGAGTTGWAKSEGGATLTVGTLDARVRFYPSEAGRIFLQFGLGVGTISADISGFGSARETGLGGVFGVGYDARIGKNVNLTPYITGFAVRTGDDNANVVQVGLGITFY